MGMIGAYAYVRFRSYRNDPRVSAVATVVAAGAVVAGVALIDNLCDVTVAGGSCAHEAWHSAHRLVVGATMAALTLGSIFAHRARRSIVANRALVWLSVISYNLYLWNSAIEVQCAHTGFPCSLASSPWSTDPNWGPHYFWSYIALSIAVAAMITFGIERPLLRLGVRGIICALRLAARPATHEPA